MNKDAWPVRWINCENSSLLQNVADGVFDEPINLDRLGRYLSSDLNWLAVVLADDLVVGQCMSVVHYHPDKQTELYLDEIGTGDDWRRRGIAQALMDATCARADQAGIDEIWLGTEPDNAAARGLYEKTGAVGDPALIYYLEW